MVAQRGPKVLRYSIIYHGHIVAQEFGRVATPNVGGNATLSATGPWSVNDSAIFQKGRRSLSVCRGGGGGTGRRSRRRFLKIEERAMNNVV